MFRKLINFIRGIFREEEPLKQIEEHKEKMNNFQSDLRNEAEERIRLLNIQDLIKDGIVKEEELPKEDVNLLKKLYCEQILELANSIEYYTKMVNG